MKIQIPFHLLLFAFLLFSGSFLMAQNDCNCGTGLISVESDASCRIILTKEKIGIKNCPDSYLVVLDSKPQNKDTIDAPGTYDYELRASKDGKLICKGLVNAIKVQGPVLLNNDFITDTIPFTEITDDSKYIGRRGSFPSPNKSFIKLGIDGKYIESDFKPDTIPNFGLPYFARNCIPNNCDVTLVWSTSFYNPSCEEASNLNLYTVMRRLWKAIDCQNNITQIEQRTAIRRPKIEDFHWNIPILKSKKITFSYGSCTNDPQKIPLDILFPVIGKTNTQIPNFPSASSLLKFSYRIQDKTTPVCNQTGLAYKRTYFIHDDCKNIVIDSFIVTLTPGENTANWLTSTAKNIELYIPKNSCLVSVRSQLNDVLSLFNLKIAPLCNIDYITWDVQQYFNDERFNSGFWYDIPTKNDTFSFSAGKFRINFTMIDKCGNLQTKTFYFNVFSKEELNIVCLPPFKAVLRQTGGRKYFRANYLQYASPVPARQPCGNYSVVRRLVSPACLKFHLNPEYDVDNDYNIIEHFEKILSGPYAGQYFTPWSNFLEAFECDLGKSVYFESKVITFDGRDKICSSFFNVVDDVSSQINIEIGQVTTSQVANICVPVKVSPFLNMAGIQFAVKFDQKLLKLDSARVTNSALKKMGFGYPGTGLNPKDRLILSWSYDGLNPVSLPNQTSILDLCFSPIGIGKGKIWIDTLNTIELIDSDNVLYNARTRTGEIQVLSKNEIVNNPSNFLSLSSQNSGINANKIRPDIRIFPNPGSDKTDILLPSSWMPEGQIILKDLQGKILLQQPIMNLLTTLNIQGLPAGINLIEIHSNDQLWIERLVIIKP